MKLILCAFPFVLFALIGILGNIIFIPIILLRLNKIIFFRFFCRLLVMYSWRFFLIVISKTGYVKYNVNCLKKSDESMLIISNHPSLLDVVYFLAYVKNLNCVVKESLARNFILFGAINACGYITNNSSVDMLDKCINLLKNGEKILIFPEGTRTKDKILFHKASSYIAVNSDVKLSYYYIKMSPRTLGKNDSWKSLPNNIKYNFELGGKIDMKNYESNYSNQIRVRKLHEKLNNIYEKEFKC